MAKSPKVIIHRWWFYPTSRYTAVIRLSQNKAVTMTYVLAAGWMDSVNKPTSKTTIVHIFVRKLQFTAFYQDDVQLKNLEKTHMHMFFLHEALTGFLSFNFLIFNSRFLHFLSFLLVLAIALCFMYKIKIHLKFENHRIITKA